MEEHRWAEIGALGSSLVCWKGKTNVLCGAVQRCSLLQVSLPEGQKVDFVAIHSP